MLSSYFSPSHPPFPALLCDVGAELKLKTVTITHFSFDKWLLVQICQPIGGARPGLQGWRREESLLPASCSIQWGPAGASSDGGSLFHLFQFAVFSESTPPKDNLTKTSWWAGPLRDLSLSSQGHPQLSNFSCWQPLYFAVPPLRTLLGFAVTASRILPTFPCYFLGFPVSDSSPCWDNWFCFCLLTRSWAKGQSNVLWG